MIFNKLYVIRLLYLYIYLVSPNSEHAYTYKLIRHAVMFNERFDVKKKNNA